MPQLKVLISGAGIAGNALAFWLSKLGHNVTVDERFLDLRASGLQVPAFRSKAAPELGLQLVNRSGKRRAYFPANQGKSGPQNFTTDFEIMRGDFCRLVYDVTKSRAKYIFGTSIEGFEDRDDGVDVRFADGRTDRYDLLVGADGVNSQTRKMMLGHDNTDDPLHPLNGQYVAYFTIRRPIQMGEEYVATIHMETKRRMVMTRRSNPDEMQIYMGSKVTLEQLNDIPRGGERQFVKDVFEGAGWMIPEILKGIDNSKDFYFERLGLVAMESLSKGRIALVGDAAYCPTVNTGMGTTSSVVGAYILAGEIGKYCGQGNEQHENRDISVNEGLMKALKSYNQTFRPFMQQVQKGVLEHAASSSVPDILQDSDLGITVMNSLVGVASFFNVNIGKYMMPEEVKGRNLPDFAELRV
ncbi:FAD/NAD(P)-binding domain-containing protein [Tothia fuscella]|uniref:FAD/NAD(P)-binding domain-containing protein n=1 Tax=Tothia fuscella TaxID=1048955 RepID=A0A9P4NEJ1_9PEZI|nr:FAD/NAD(P)-binding domain-containing protein [Tothia fuscella]